MDNIKDSLDEVYDYSGYWTRIDYTQPAMPLLSQEDAQASLLFIYDLPKFTENLSPFPKNVCMLAWGAA